MRLGAIAFSLLLISVDVARSQPILVAANVVNVVTPWGQSEAASLAVAVQDQVTVAVFLDYLSPEDMVHVKSDLQTLYVSMAGHRPAPRLRIALLEGGSIRFAGPFSAR